MVKNRERRNLKITNNQIFKIQSSKSQFPIKSQIRSI